ncbi:MAG: TIGR01777 family oxidoreductase [Deltaproteobacteria bacterium]
MKILVTGATGLIGKALVRELLAAGDEVRVVTRNEARAREVLPDLCRFSTWNVERHELDPSVFAGVDAVVHLAGEPVAKGRWTPKRKKAIFSSRVRGADLLTDTIASLPEDARPGTFISASAVGFYGDTGKFRVDETVLNGYGFLSEVCQAWEAEALAARSLGMRAVAMRIGMVLSRDGGVLERVLPIFRLGLGGNLGSGRQWVAWIHIDDLLSLFRFALSDARIEGPLNATSPRPVMNEEFTLELGRALGRSTLLGVPAFVLKMVFGEQSELFLSSTRAVPNKAAHLMFGFRYPDLATALADLVGHH